MRLSNALTDMQATFVVKAEISHVDMDLLRSRLNAADDACKQIAVRDDGAQETRVSERNGAIEPPVRARAAAIPINAVSARSGTATAP